jgi:hypothetical protein
MRSPASGREPALSLSKGGGERRRGTASFGRRNSAGSGGLIPPRVLDRLKDLEALELGMAEIERLVGAGVAVGGAKMLRLRPGGEGVFARPDRVRRIEHVIVALSGPRNRWNSMNPGTRSRWVSRESHTCSNALSAPFMTLNRFMAIYIGRSPFEMSAPSSLRPVNLTAIPSPRAHRRTGGGTFGAVASRASDIGRPVVNAERPSCQPYSRT